MVFVRSSSSKSCSSYPPNDPPLDTALARFLFAPKLATLPQRLSLSFLVAEDNAVNQRLIVRLLEKRGHSVVLVQNGLGLGMFKTAIRPPPPETCART
jgi:hypothetical protein